VHPLHGQDLGVLALQGEPGEGRPHGKLFVQGRPGERREPVQGEPVDQHPEDVIERPRREDVEEPPAVVVELVQVAGEAPFLAEAVDGAVEGRLLPGFAEFGQRLGVNPVGAQALLGPWGLVHEDVEIRDPDLVPVVGDEVVDQHRVGVGTSGDADQVEPWGHGIHSGIGIDLGQAWPKRQATGGPERPGLHCR